MVWLLQALRVSKLSAIKVHFLRRCLHNPKWPVVFAHSMQLKAKFSEVPSYRFLFPRVLEPAVLFDGMQDKFSQSRHNVIVHGRIPRGSLSGCR